MTTFQKFIIITLIGSGLIFFYFWRSDVEYERRPVIKELDRLLK